MTAEEIATQLARTEELPLVVVRKSALEEGAEKTLTVMNYVEAHSYAEVFGNEEYAVYAGE